MSSSLPFHCEDLFSPLESVVRHRVPEADAYVEDLPILHRRWGRSKRIYISFRYRIDLIFNYQVIITWVLSFDVGMRSIAVLSLSGQLV